MQEQRKTNWWLIGILIALAVIVLSCLAACFGAAVAVALVPRTYKAAPPAVATYEAVPIQPYTGPAAPAPPFRGRGGALITDVVRNSPADQAGLVPGDIITAVDGKPITGDTGLSDAIGRMRPGESVRLSVRHAASGQTREITVKLGANPSDPSRPYLGIEYRMMPMLGENGQ